MTRSRPVSLDRESWTVVGLALLLLAGLWAGTWAVVERGRDQDTQAAAVNGENLARVLSESVNGTLRRLDSQLLAAAGIIGDSPDVLAAGLQVNARMGMRLFVSDSDGRTFSDPERASERISVEDRDFFRMLRDDPRLGLVIGRPVISRHSQTWVLPLARRLHSKDGAFTGIAFRSLPLAQLTGLFESIHIGSMGVVVMFDENTAFVARHPEPDGPGTTLNRKVGSPEFARTFAAGREKGSYQAHSTTDGTLRIYSYRRIGDLPLFIMVGLAERDYLADWREWRDLMVVSASAISLVVVLALAGILVLQGRRRQAQAQLAGQQRELEMLVEGLSRSEERYRQILRTASDGIHVLDSFGNLVEASDSFLAMLGYESERPATLSVFDWEAGCSRDELANQLLPQLMAGPRVFESVHRRRDGSLIQVELSTRPVELGDRAFLFASARDIGERKAAEEQRRKVAADLATASAQLRQVLDTAAEGIFGLDGHSMVTFANPAAAAILGWEGAERLMHRQSAEAMGHRLADGRNCTEGHCAIRQTLLDGQVRRVSNEFFVDAAGRPVPVEYVVSPVGGGGEGGAVVVFHDFTERKALEGELKRSNAMLEQFAYVTSHDLRQPLRMITSYLTLLERQLSDRLAEEEKSFLDFAVGGARRMDRLILGLLDYSRVGRDARLEPVPLAEVVAEALDNLKIAIQEASAVVLVPDHLPVVPGNRLELMRLVQNLVGNALKYRFPDRAPEVRLECRQEGGAVIVSVGDNGIGIAPGDQERVFGIFQRLVTQEEYEGTGIGLAICKKIVERHGGRIWLESELGAGATFFFSLPAG